MSQSRLLTTLKVAFVAFVAIAPILLVIFGYVMRLSLFRYLLYSFSFYGIFTVTHLVIQYILAVKARKQFKTEENFHPRVTVLVPVYNEEESLFRECLLSLTRQTYPIEVIVSNDGDDALTKRIFGEFATRPGWTYIEDVHEGKRPAMKRGFDIVTGEIVVDIDSDTMLDPDAVARLIKPFANPRVGCATGNITVLNKNDNVLTWLTNMRYWLAFNFERAAQSALGVMSCVSGPLGGIRMEVINQIKDQWVNQTFLGRRCTYGDDRHLTNLVLSLGYQSVFVPDANAQTLAPVNFWKWLNQQLRWSRSFNREYLLNWKWFHKHNIWLAVDLTYQAVFPLLLTINVVIMCYLALTRNPAYWLLWLALVLFFGLLRALYAIVFTKRLEFLGFTLYSLIYMFLLLPLKWYSVFTMRNTTWGTR